MTLPDFKRIYFWEYLHRLAGIFVLGGLQGSLGWFMVKSGLVDQPRVSPQPRGRGRPINAG
jgi:heme A synthase